MLLLGRLLGWRFPQRGPSTLAARLAVCACLLAAVPARSTAAADTQAGKITYYKPPLRKSGYNHYV